MGVCTYARVISVRAPRNGIVFPRRVIGSGVLPFQYFLSLADLHRWGGYVDIEDTARAQSSICSVLLFVRGDGEMVVVLGLVFMAFDCTAYGEVDGGESDDEVLMCRGRCEQRIYALTLFMRCAFTYRYRPWTLLLKTCEHKHDAEFSYSIADLDGIHRVWNSSPCTVYRTFVS